MITPLEIEGKEFRSAFAVGYSKRDVDDFIKDILKSYETIYKENIEFKDKIMILQDGIQYYKNIEDTLQKTLLLAEKTADETRSNARVAAEKIEKEAELKVETLMIEARKELQKIQAKINESMQQYELQRLQIKQILNTQLEYNEKCVLNTPNLQMEKIN